MGGKRKTRALRVIVAGGLTAALLVPAAPASATSVCRGHSQPGITITVAGIPIRIPAIVVNVCVDTATPTSLVPIVDLVTGPQAGSPCQTNCFALQLRTSPDRPDTVVSVTVTLDGTGVSRTITLPVPGGPGGLCLVSAGFPDPPIFNCLVRVDPDGM